MEDDRRYRLRCFLLPEASWQRVTREGFVQAERAAGFYPNGGGDGPATAGFYGGGVEGAVTYDDAPPNP